MRKHGMAVTLIFIAMAVVIVTSVTSCDSAGKNPIQARKELGQLSIQYSEVAFNEAAKNGDKLAVELFIETGMSVNARSNALITASWFGRTEIVKLLIEKGADVNAISAGSTALSLASANAHKEGYKEIVQLLKNAGAKR
jgi:ankyrin repeat protein